MIINDVQKDILTAIGVLLSYLIGKKVCTVIEFNFFIFIKFVDALRILYLNFER